jgi:hypothetical protein
MEVRESWKTGATTARYLVLFQFIRSKRVDPEESPDTTTSWAPSVPGGAKIIGQDWAFACTPDEKRLRDLSVAEGDTNELLHYCARSFQEPKTDFHLVGWVRLQGPPLTDTSASGPQ